MKVLFASKERPPRFPCKHQAWRKMLEQPFQSQMCDQDADMLEALNTIAQLHKLVWLILGGHQILGSRSKYSSSSFAPPSPSPSSFSDSMNSIRSIHLTILYPSWFSTRSRSGAPCSLGSVLPFNL